MTTSNLTAIFAAFAFLTAPGARAQPTPDPSGHWQGAVEAPRGRLAFEVDFARNEDGTLAGTISLPADHVNGLPLARVELDGSTLKFSARSDQVLSGVLSADGTSMSGTFTVSEGSAPFSAARTGAARIEQRPRLRPVTDTFAGTWNGTLDAGHPLRLVLTLTNQPDGTSSGAIVNLDEGGLTIPVSAMSTAGPEITLELKAIDGTYTATLNGDGKELTGTLKQGATTLPLTFHRNP